MDARALLAPLRDLFFPPHCAGCGVAVDSPWLCAPCRDSLEFIKSPRCEVCSQPFSGMLDHFTCSNCQDRAFFFTSAVAVLKSAGPIREMIHRFKYNGQLWLAQPLAEFLAEGLSDERLDAEPISLLVPVPLHPLRKREREYNQAEILARTLGKRLRLPVSDALKRVRYTETQTHFDRRDRMQNLRDAFTMRQNKRVQGNRILLVDDVFTTGSTLNECARVLIEAGAQSVHALTVARG